MPGACGYASYNNSALPHAVLVQPSSQLRIDPPAIEDANDAIEMQAFHGRVDAALATLAIDVDCTDVYCCGAPPMVNAVKTMCLQQLGMAPERFHSDVFAPGPAP